MDNKEKKYTDYIKLHNPGVTIKDIKFDFTNGSHNDLAIVNENTVFKFAKYDWSACYLTNEIRSVSLIKKYVGIALPDTVSLGPGVARCTFIKGRPLYRNELLLRKSLEQELLAKQLGIFLTQLHSIPLEDAESNKIENRLSDIDAEYWNTQWKEMQRKLFPYCDEYTKECIRQIFRPALEKKKFFSYTPSVIHADLNPRHMICDAEAYRINAILGFGSAGIGDPAFDIGTLLAYLGESFVSRIAEYDESVPELLDRARFYAYLQRLNHAKDLADRITTRDFTDFKMVFGESDIMSIGKH